MVELKWCKSQRQGILLIDSNHNLAKEYIKNSEETLFSLKNNIEDSNMWKATKKYYAEYLAVYALFMKIGIKCEIHDCTIKLVEFLEEFNLFPNNTFELLKKDKQLRIDNQYYLKNIDVNFDYNTLYNFVLEIKNKINSITPNEIKLIKKKLE